MEWRAPLKQTKANELNEDREGALFASCLNSSRPAEGLTEATKKSFWEFIRKIKRLHLPSSNHTERSACVVRRHSFKKMYVVCPRWTPKPGIVENLFSKLLILQKQSSVQVVPEPLLNNVGIVHLEGENWRGLLRWSISPFSCRLPLVCHGMAKAPF